MKDDLLAILFMCEIRLTPMEPIGNLSWREYYSRERVSRKDEIDQRISHWWDREDQMVENVFMNGGLLSFPHTYLDASMLPMIRTVRALLKTGKKRVIALGVMHGVSNFEPVLEFSLDTFRYIFKETSNIVGARPPELEEIFLPMRPKGEGVILDRLRDQVNDVKEIKDRLDKDTAIVITGDLSHYGAPYGTKDIIDEPSQMIKDQIMKCFDLIYRQRDLEGYYDLSLKCGNDQWAVATAASSLFEGELETKVFSLDLSDYSEVFQVPPPCYVASVFYGMLPE